MADINPTPGQLNWRLSAHPITLLTFLSFRIGTPIPPSLSLFSSHTTCRLTIDRTLPSRSSTASLLVYLLGMLFTSNFVMIFIITIILLAMDFYYLKNIAGRRLVGLRWWNEVNGQSGDSHWVFESAPQANEPGGKIVNATDKRFFWLALYAQPALWVALAVVALVKFMFVWLTLVGECLLGGDGEGEEEEEEEKVVVRGTEKRTDMRTAIAMVLTITNTLAFSRCDKFSQASGLVERGLFTGSLARNVGGAMFSRLFNRG